MQYRKRLFEKHICSDDGRRREGWEGFATVGLWLCSKRWISECWVWQQGLQPLSHPLATIKASSDMGQVCNLESGCWEKKAVKRLVGGFLPWVAYKLSSLPELHCVCVPVPGCVPCWPLPWLPSLTLDLPHHCKLVSWVQDCGWPWLMPLDLLCLLRDCGTMLLACEVPGSWLASLGRGLAAPRDVCLAGLGFFSSVENKLLSCCLSVHENGQVCLGGWTWGNMWRGIILKGYWFDHKKINCTDLCSWMVIYVKMVTVVCFIMLNKVCNWWLQYKFFGQEAGSVLWSKRRRLYDILSFLLT